MKHSTIGTSNYMNIQLVCDNTYAYCIKKIIVCKEYRKWSDDMCQKIMTSFFYFIAQYKKSKSAESTAMWYSIVLHKLSSGAFPMHC